MKLLPLIAPKILSLALAMNLGLAHFAEAEEPEKILKIGLLQDFDTLNPLMSSMLASTYVYNMVGRKLVTLDAQMQWQPQLAEAIPSLAKKTAEKIVIDQKKVIRATWTLKKNAQWADGKSVVCEDVQFSKTLGGDQNIAVANRDQYDMVREVICDAKEPKKVVIVYNSDRWDFYRAYQFYILPSHLEKPIYEKFQNIKEGYEKNSLYAAKPQELGLYNGPFVISEVKPGSHILLKKNPLFYGTPAHFDQILLKIISNSNTVESLLATHEIDMVANIALNLDQALLLDKKVAQEKWPYKVVYTPAFTYEHIDLNLENEILRDLETRKALFALIDRELLVKSLFENKQIVAEQFLSPRDPWFVGLKTFSHEILSRKQALKVLEKKGWKLNATDGYRYRDGKKLNLSFTTTAGNKLRETVAAFLQDQFKKGGVELTIKNFPPRVFFGEIVKNRKFDGLAMYAWTFLPETPPTVFYHSKNIPTAENSFAGRNYMAWKNKLVDELTIQLETESDPRQQKKLVQKIAQQYVQDRPTFPLYNRVDVSISPLNLKHYQPTGHQQVESNFVELWE